ncbi:helix-turn-helix domain-containing protein [Vreelandella titanicae]|uniref:helix-turn-helix domain-containing protein n=1 Tax=Vreelandella titanicae TaxID=664683 RepID=UPI0011441B65|nr:helix-turn-helix domain-containing protein [Halomonas titanicae]
MSIAFHHCTDVTEHAMWLPGWQQEFDQIDEGRFAGEIIDISEQGIRLFRERANLAVSQLMRFPEDQWHLAMPLRWPNNSLFRSDAITVLPRCNEFLGISPAGYDLLVVSIDLNRHSWLEHNARKSRVLVVTPDLFKMVKQQWWALTEHLRACGGEATPCAQQAIMCQLKDGIDLLLESPSCNVVSDDSSNYRTRRYIVDRCHALSKMHPDNPPSMMALCHQLNISRRTLQYSFQAETGQSPVHYLRALRLNAVRRSLMRDPTLCLADAAAQQGFFHQSYFSREYRRLFLELPSDTRKRSQEA